MSLSAYSTRANVVCFLTDWTLNKVLLTYLLTYLLTFLLIGVIVTILQMYIHVYITTLTLVDLDSG